MTEITLTSQERSTESLQDTTLDRAEQGIRTDGFIVLKDVIDHDHLDAIHEQMKIDLQTILNLDVVPHQFVYGNVQQDPPPFPPFLFRDVLENPWVNQISHRILGEGAFNCYYSGNTNIPESKLQPVHVDNGDLWGGLSHPHPAYQLVVNISPHDVTEENGSIEMWPESHLLMSNVLGEDIKVDPDLLDRRREEAPPVRGNTVKGDILIRDMRVWHRGTPNSSPDPRFMIALKHEASFTSIPMRRQKFSPESADVLKRMDGLTEYEISENYAEYLTRQKPYDYPTKGRI